jgi:cysteinyl-tRNA synthetase
LERLFAAMETLENLPVSEQSTVDVAGLKEKCFAALNDDLNSAMAIAHLFDGVRLINSVKSGQENISAPDLEELKSFFHTFVFEILGLKPEIEAGQGGSNEVLDKIIDLVLNLRLEAKTRKDWATADKIRDNLNALGVEIKDTKEGFEWSLK